MSLKTFVEEAINDFATVASVSPSSKFLAEAMSEPLPLRQARVAVEFGAGTGVITVAMLERLPLDAKLFVFEINKRFLECLRSNITDPRMVLIDSSVENLDTELHKYGIQQVDAVASSLGLAFLGDVHRQELFQRLAPFLHRGSVLTQYQYVHGLQFDGTRLSRLDLMPLFRQYFSSVECKIEWRNLPPAFVFTCRT
jgi:phospholipid N-methyltransferase